MRSDCEPRPQRAYASLCRRRREGPLGSDQEGRRHEALLHDLDDLHQLDFIHNRQMAKEIERLRVLSTTIVQQRDSWKVRALMAETQLLEATAKTSNNGGRQNVSDVRYASLKRYLAKRFHPDYAPGQGIEKIVRNEIFKEIWNEIDRLDQGLSATRFATARSSSAA